MKSKVTAKKIVENPIVPVISLTLQLTKRDAVALYRATQMIGGCPDNSARGVFASIESVLYSQGIRDNENCVSKNNGSGFYFQNYDEYDSK